MPHIENDDSVFGIEEELVGIICLLVKEPPVDGELILCSPALRAAFAVAAEELGHLDVRPEWSLAAPCRQYERSGHQALPSNYDDEGVYQHQKTKSILNGAKKSRKEEDSTCLEAHSHA